MKRFRTRDKKLRTIKLWVIGRSREHIDNTSISCIWRSWAWLARGRLCNPKSKMVFTWWQHHGQSHSSLSGRAISSAGATIVQTVLRVGDHSAEDGWGRPSLYFPFRKKIGRPRVAEISQHLQECNKPGKLHTEICTDTANMQNCP